jgi:hypothetical protein
MTAALEEGEWSAARPGRTLTRAKNRYPLYRRLGGTQGRSGEVENLVPTGIRSRTVQPVVSTYKYLSTCKHFLYLLGKLGKFRKATIRFGMSVCLSTWNNSAPTGRNFVKFYI